MEKNKIEKVYDQIHAPESLKQKTFEKIKQTAPKKNKNYSFILSIAAMFIFTIAVGTAYYINKPVLNNDELEGEKVAIEVQDTDLNHFKSVQDLREYFDKTYSQTTRYYDGGIANEEMAEVQTVLSDTNNLETKSAEDTSATMKESSNYYTTNTQVENVDEADIVKTDGNYIYYVTNNTIYIVKADELKLETKLDFSVSDDENTRYYPSELFIKDNKLIVIGNFVKYSQEGSLQDTLKSRIIQSSINTTKAYIYDIQDKANPKELRQVDIDGNYNTSRLIGSTLYLISSKYMYYTPDMEDSDILPLYYDNASSEEYQNVDCKNIVYNENSSDNTYQTIGAVNIESNDELLVETFLGYGNTVYCSENNLYITAPIYNNENTEILNSTEIYKFNISSGGLKYSCKTTISGDINNQFSLDEYDGNLRVATTVTIEEEPAKTSSDNGYEVVEIGKTTTNNILYVLDENLEKIGELTDFGIEEKIYSVRFIGKVAYIVTFEEVDPLFVIDLSDPQNPVMKGELEIPGYSSYLHPYDENHIIGIGYNVKDNGYGGVTNETVKLSMFDVSDLSNPKEIFSKTLGEGYSYSSVTYDHKLLMYDKQRSLIGFPITMKENGKMQESILLLNIDLENNEFKIHSQYTMGSYNYYMRKVIYIEDILYILCDNKILAFNINTSDSIGTLDLPYERSNLYKTETSSDTVELNVEE